MRATLVTSWIRGALGAATALALSGCGPSALEAEVRDLSGRVATLEQQDARAEQRMAEIETRLAIVSDQVAAARHASARDPLANDAAPPPPLPTVTLQPQVPVLTNVGASAPRSDGPRTAAPVAASHSPAGPPVAYPDPAAVTERLSVVPLPTGSPAGAPPLSTSPEPPRPADASVSAYQAAYAPLETGDYALAQAGLARFLDAYPTSAYAANALYWLGETYYAQKQFTRALDQFQAVTARFPSGNKAPDALLKQALCYVNLGDPRTARVLLADVTTKFPRSGAARLARVKLEELH